MSELSEVYRRLSEGEPPSPTEIDMIVREIRHKRMLYEGGKAPKDDDVEMKADVLNTFKASLPPKPKLKRRA
jgi:hypothetical protein